ncbi:MAG TPA: phospholipase C, phosphocholine-specific [Puia sp.]|nr:phospholipase C, phosphocholine-specific [Puia sp.]
MDNRREFLKKAMLLSGAAGWNGLFPESIRKAMAIDPSPGSSYLDAEHVVILMQENRSFDHCFGTLKGVRGLNDPRALRLPGRNSVWLQSNEKGETYAPFRLDIRDTKITWMGSIPHVRSSQVDAFNRGRHDRWLTAKRSGNPEYADIPLTLGHYTREDLPFNYALADAFTVCDQNFCSGMTSTWPNRLFFWTGTIRQHADAESKAYIRNDVETGEISWTTFPELLERAGISWKVYQNDLTVGDGLTVEERAWLANFGCNLLEPFAQYNVRFFPRYVHGLKTRVETFPGILADLKSKAAALPAGSGEREKLEKEIAKKEAALAEAREELPKWTPENFERLSETEKNLYRKAFAINDGDPDYHRLETLRYEEDGVQRELNVPRGDILHQFRQDVDKGTLPAVSWLVGPENFSDHPTAPWYGAWYVSEIMDILTKNPEVWKKTIFILTYDENDGYFDHVPPYVAPDPKDPATGKCSAGIDTTVEYIRRETELRQGVKPKEAREAPAGLGFRVPMIVASPWSRGGRVCSQVFDHTSVFRFVQTWLNQKKRAGIAENNVSLWRKTVSGDLTAVFQVYDGRRVDELPWLERKPFIEKIYNAKFKPVPANYKPLTAEETERINRDPAASPLMGVQEPGVKPSCALPYQLYADGRHSEDGRNFEITLEARDEVFGKRSAGSPFNIYRPDSDARSYAVIAGDKVTDSFPIGRGYHLVVQGPNGFGREYQGNEQDPRLRISCDYERSRMSARMLTGRLKFVVHNTDPHRAFHLVFADHAYGKGEITRELAAGGAAEIVLGTESGHGWYDVGIRVKGFDVFGQRYSGRVETGRDGISDPFMGRAI